LAAMVHAGNALVLQARLDLNTPWVGSAVQTLRDRGYFFGGALPRCFNGDGFFKQRLLCPPDFPGIFLDIGDAAQLLGMVRRDKERAEAVGGAGMRGGRRGT
jgi:hypothetical protein